MTTFISDSSIESYPSNIKVEGCRYCSKQYNFRLPSNTLVTVLCGRPPPETSYKAVSYLWENTILLDLECLKCNNTKPIPMRDGVKLLQILAFVGGTSKVWLDALSIDQDDDSDLKEQLVVMGDIYRSAEVVSVFLPSQDEAAYELLAKLATKSDIIIKVHNRLGGFAVGEMNQEQKANLISLADEYATIVEEWDANIAKWNYWKRAWTFQEWTMAAEVEIIYEGIPENVYLKCIKNVIVMASSIITGWKMYQAREIDLGTNALKHQEAVRYQNGRVQNLVRTHFPFQDFLVADEAVDAKTLRKLTYIMPQYSLDSGTSLRSTLPSIHPKNSDIQSILRLSLNAFASSAREARFEADRIACWASMCGIGYDYCKHDSFAMALCKVVRVLRQKGYKVFNWLVNTVGGELDLLFLEYAAAMRRSNSAVKVHMFGNPVFTGRADTVTHIRHCLSQDGGMAAVLPSSIRVTLQEVKGATIGEPVSWADQASVLSTLTSIVTGEPDKSQATDVLLGIKGLMKDISSKHSDRLSNFLFVPISIKVNDLVTTWEFRSWTVIPSRTEHGNMCVAREILNGTLVLAELSAENEMRIVAYLYMTNQIYGTYLITSNERGLVDIVFRNPDPWLRGILGNMEGLDMLDQANDINIELDAKHYKLENEKLAGFEDGIHADLFNFRTEVNLP